MNEHDSEKIQLMLANHGFLTTDVPKDADLILFNTCTIREKAHHKAMSEIGRAKIYKTRKQGVIVGVCGCVAQEEKEAIFERYPHVDILFGPDQIAMLPELLKNAMASGRSSALDLINDPDEYHFLNLPSTIDHRPSTAFVSIMKGCNCACSYCIVPNVRGREVSRPAHEIVNEVARLAKSGTKEVVLLGQNVNAYNFRSQNQEARGKNSLVTFASLIRMITDETDIQRIRFTSPHPRDVGDDLIREYAENEKLMPHIHLPAQAGSNSVLKKMRRGYTREKYLEIAEALKKTRAGFSITTDLIVGFCGESRDDFESTMELMLKVEFDSCFAFKYSPRPGTEAALKFEDDVPEKEKEERLERLLKLQRETSAKKNEALIGLESQALATGLDKMERGLVTGRLPDNRIIHFSGNSNLVGNIVRVRVTAAHANSLAGEAIK